MEAKTLPKKKTICKGKIKKSIKNVLCRPDAEYWPQLTDNESQELETALGMYKVNIPVYKKPHWNKLKGIAKEKRPKAPAIPKVEGLIFGMSECLNAVRNGSSWAVIFEGGVVPRSIVLPTIDACVQTNIPVVCLNGLRKISLNNFGVATSSLGIKKEYLPDLRNKILIISNKYKPPKIVQSKKEPIEDIKKDVELMDVDATNENQNEETKSKNKFTYLHRPDKKTRVFIPSDAKILNGAKNNFLGQDFIRFTKIQESKPKSNEFMRMSVKKILGNTNRVKRKKK